MENDYIELIGLADLDTAGHGKPKRIESLECIPWTMDLVYDELFSLGGYLASYQLPAGKVLFDEGSREPYLVILIEGKIEILKLDSTMCLRLVTTLRDGKVFGEMTLMDGEPRSATARAKEDSVIYVLTKENYRFMQEQDPRLALIITLKMAKFVSQKLRQTTGQWVEMIEQYRKLGH